MFVQWQLVFLPVMSTAVIVIKTDIAVDNKLIVYKGAHLEADLLNLLG